MKEELGTRGAAVGAAVLAVLFGGLALAIYPGWAAIGHWAERADAPAWVQAVGSILAIVGAGWIAGWQASTARRDVDRRERRADTNKALAILYIFRRADLVVENAWRSLKQNETTWRLAADQVELVQHALRALPVFDIPSARLVFEVQRTDRDLLYILRILRNKIEGVPRAKVIGDGVFKRIRGRIQAAMIVCVAGMDESGLQEVELTAFQKNHPISPELGEGD
jgi:hypothetical protein